MSFPRYPDYRESGVEWLGEVPEHWEVRRLKRVLSLLTEKTEQRSLPIALENIESWSGRFIPTETAFEGEGVAFQPGDILFGKLRPYLAKVLLADKSGEAVGDFHVLRPNSDVDGRFAQHQILNDAFISVVDGSTFGAKMPRASWDFLGGMAFALPPSSEQSAIAAFLDRETGKIDALVVEQEKLIELLKEKRQAVISHAVTKGLDPTAPMKDSGTEWLGDVPVHWSLMKIKHLAALISKGTTPTTIGANFVDDGVRFLKAENIFDGVVCPTPEFFIDVETHQLLARSSLLEGDVLVVIAGATTGKSAILPEELVPSNTNQAVSFIRLKSTSLSEFVCSWLSTSEIQEKIRLSAVQSAQPNLSMEDLGNLPITHPPQNELENIVEHIRTTQQEFSLLIVESQRAIALLKEHRSALISAAVTGKIDVRGLVASQEAA